LLNLCNLLGEEREGNRADAPRRRRQGRHTSVPHTGHVWTLKLATRGSGRKASCCKFVFASTGNGSARAQAAAVALLLTRGAVPLLLLEQQPKREGEPPAWARRRRPSHGGWWISGGAREPKRWRGEAMRGRPAITPER
jgi:hypothetical protein